MRRLAMTNERSVTDRLYDRYAEMEKEQGPTIEDERTVQASKAKSLRELDDENRARFSSLVEKGTQAARAVEAGDSEHIEAEGAKVLKAQVENLMDGRGGFAIERDEFRQVEAHRDRANERYSVTDKSLAAYRVEILLPSGGTKTAKCVVSYDAAQQKADQFVVQGVFYDNLEQERPLTAKGLKAYLAGQPAKVVQAQAGAPEADNRPMVFFNADERVLGYEELEVPPQIRAVALARLAQAGFEIDLENLGRETGIGKLAHVVVAAPDRHEELRSITAAIVDKWDDKSWFDRAAEDDDKYHVKNDDTWFDRAQQKEEMPNQPHDWFERSEEKPEQEGIASGAYSGTKMLRFEQKRGEAATRKNPVKAKSAAKNARRARRAKKGEAQKRVLTAADRMERLAKAPQRPFTVRGNAIAALKGAARSRVLKAMEGMENGEGLAGIIEDQVEELIENIVEHKLDSLVEMTETVGDEAPMDDYEAPMDAPELPEAPEDKDEADDEADIEDIVGDDDEFAPDEAMGVY